MLESELRAAIRAEGALCLGAGRIGLGITLRELKIPTPHAEPRDERCSSRSTANRTMTVRLMERRRGCLVSNLPAMTTAGEHGLGLLRVRGGPTIPGIRCVPRVHVSAFDHCSRMKNPP